MNALIGFGLGLLSAVIVVMAFCIWAVQRDNSGEPLPYTKGGYRGGKGPMGPPSVKSRDGIDLDAKDAAHRGVPDPKFDRRAP